MSYSVNHSSRGEKRPLPSNFETNSSPAKRTRFNTIENANSPHSPYEATAIKMDELCRLNTYHPDFGNELLYYERNLFSLGKRHFDEGNHSEAISHLGKISPLDPNHLDAQYFLGEAYSCIQNYEKADSFFKSIPPSHPKFPQARLWLAMHWRTSAGRDHQEFSDAFDNINRALNSEFITTHSINFAHWIAGSILFDAGNIANAIEHLKKVELDEEDEFNRSYFQIAQQYLGHSYSQQGKYQKAIEHFNIALEISSEAETSRHILECLAVCLEKLGKEKESEIMSLKAAALG